MTHDEAFLQAILESPDDDTPRLVYADWLDEHGDSARAEFIRVQCAIDQLSFEDPSLPDLFGRESRLLGKHTDEWLGELRQSLVRWTFYRGFLDEIVLSVPAYLEKRPLPRPVTIRRVGVDLTTDPAAILGRPHSLGRVTRIAAARGPRVRFYAETDPSAIGQINCGILFLMSFWSGPSVMAFHHLGEVLEAVDRNARLDLVVVDIDGCSKKWHQVPEFRNVGGYGETAWVKDGQIVRALPGRPQEGFESHTRMLLQQCSE
jgi:uncharacterized protein (TIGR02996 family)